MFLSDLLHDAEVLALGIIVFLGVLSLCDWFGIKLPRRK